MQTLYELKMRVIALAAKLAAGEYQFLVAIRELEDAAVPDGCTFAEYVAHICNMDVSVAYEKTRVARRLLELPLISVAFERGQLTYSKVRILTRAASAVDEALFLEWALISSVRQLERIVAAFRKLTPEDDASHMAKRFMQLKVEDDGMFVLRAKLSPDEGAILRKACDAARVAGAENQPDALVLLAKVAIAELATGDEKILHVEKNAVEGVAISDATHDRLCCENPDKRTISVSQRRVLQRRQGGTCAHPQCTNRLALDGHHVVPWSHGGKTVLTNLILLCGKHHRLLHEGGWSVRYEDNALVFRDATGAPIPAAPPLPEVAIADRDLSSIAPPDLDTRGIHTWRGDRLNLRAAMEAFQSHHARHKQNSPRGEFSAHL